MPDTYARMRQLIGTTAQWAANDLVLGDGEIGVETVGSGGHWFKIGDGARHWSALPYSSVTQQTDFGTFASDALGNDSTGNGTFASPYKTWDKAYGATPAGGTIWLDGTPEVPQVYKSTSGALTSISKEITVRAINRHGAIVTSNGVTAAALAISSTGGDTINLIGVIIDPSPNGSSTKRNTLYLFSMATAYYVNCTDCLFRGWTGVNAGVGVSTSGIDFRGHLRFTRCTFIGDSCANAMRIDYLEQGGIEFNDCDITLTNQNTVSNGAVRIVGTEPGVYARILNCRTAVSLDLSAATDSSRFGYNIINVKAAMVSGGTIDILGPGSVCSAFGVVISTNGAGDASELSIDDSVIEDLSIYCEPSGGGIACLIGADGAGDPAKCNRCIIQRVKVRGSYEAGVVGGLHGLILGSITNGQMVHNEVVGTALSGFKNTLNCDARHNRFWGCTGYGFVCRNAKNGTVADNEIVFSPAAPPSAAALLYLADVDGNVTSGVNIARNTFANEGGTGVVAVLILAGSSATFTANAWMNLCGTLNANIFRVGATNYTTFAGWHGAVGTTDVANFPEAMPDPSLSDALAEAAALAPADEVIHHTLEIRHPDFLDVDGNPDSLWITNDTQALSAPLEADAPIRPGETVTFIALAFNFTLMPIEPGTTPEIEITLDGVNRAIVHYLDMAMESAKPIVVAYRPYLDSAIEDGPQMSPVPTFELSEVNVALSSVSMKARTGIDLRVSFPVRQYNTTEFPGLAGR